MFSSIPPPSPSISPSLSLCHTTALGNGDPHISTLDSTTYTFNGHGEFTMLNALNGTYILQARAAPLVGKILVPFICLVFRLQLKCNCHVGFTSFCINVRLVRFLTSCYILFSYFCCPINLIIVTIYMYFNIDKLIVTVFYVWNMQWVFHLYNMINSAIGLRHMFFFNKPWFNSIQFKTIIFLFLKAY